MRAYAGQRSRNSPTSARLPDSAAPGDFQLRPQRQVLMRALPARGIFLPIIVADQCPAAGKPVFFPP
jgi:hypothetical protein